MYEISIFVKELKGRFAQGYNRRHGRCGVLWAERFKSDLLEGGEALAAVAAYIDLSTAQTVVDEQNGELSLPEGLRCRIRYFTDGVILGSQSFVETHFYNLKEKLGYRRQHTGTALTVLGSSDRLWVFREPRVQPSG